MYCVCFSCIWFNLCCKLLPAVREKQNIKRMNKWMNEYFLSIDILKNSSASNSSEDDDNLGIFPITSYSSVCEGLLGIVTMPGKLQCSGFYEGESVLQMCFKDTVYTQPLCLLVSSLPFSTTWYFLRAGTIMYGGASDHVSPHLRPGNGTDHQVQACLLFSFWELGQFELQHLLILHERFTGTLRSNNKKLEKETGAASPLAY